MIFAYIFIIGVPALLIYFVIKKMMKARSILEHGTKTSALIINIYTQRFNKGSMDILTLEYKDSAGRPYGAKASVTVGKYRVGQRMSVSYLPQNPTQYTLDNGKGYWILLIFCILLFGFMIFASFKINEMVQAGNYHFTG